LLRTCANDFQLTEQKKYNFRISVYRLICLLLIGSLHSEVTHVQFVKDSIALNRTNVFRWPTCSHCLL